MEISAYALRKTVLRIVYEKNSGHIGGSFSIADVMSYLFSNYNLVGPDSHKFILSKGHAAPILYAALYELGILSDLDLHSFREVDSKLQGHPDKVRLPEVIATTGSLGQGLSIAIGHALAIKLKGSDKNVFCVVGDGELQEGQIWESLMLAPKFKLANLCCLVDHNKSQNDGFVKDILPLDPLDEKIKAFGWNVIRISGHDRSQIQFALENFESYQNGPTLVILDTIKGMGVSFMQTPEWHAKVPNEEEYKRAIEELM